MAIIKLGGTVVGIRGTIGGLIYSANKAGPYVKAWARGANPRTALQQESRGFLSAIGPAWEGLSSAQQTAWDTLAAADPEPHTNPLGEDIVFSGYLLFSMFNKRRLQVGLAIEDDAPTGAEATQPSARAITGFGIDISSSQALISWDTTGAPNDEYCVLLLALRPVPGPVFQSNMVAMGYQFADVVLGLDFTSTFLATFGSDVVDWVATAWLYTQRESGIRSVVDTDTAVVTL